LSPTGFQIDPDNTIVQSVSDIHLIFADDEPMRVVEARIAAGKGRDGATRVDLRDALALVFADVEIVEPIEGHSKRFKEAGAASASSNTLNCGCSFGRLEQCKS